MVTLLAKAATGNAGNSASPSATYNVLTPEEAIGELQGDIQALVDDGVLNCVRANGLLQPLDNALRRLDKGKTADAFSQLQDFSDEVNVKTPEPLDTATAADLIADANAIRDAISRP